jgi:hypothetical protein
MRLSVEAYMMRTTIPLSANVRETPNPWKFSVEGESGNEDVHDPVR